MISAIVPSRHGQSRLDRNLGSVAASLESSGQRWEILVVDDGGGDIVLDGPGVRVIALAAGGGYGPAINAGVAQSSGDCLLILNDDVRLGAETVGRLLRYFPDETLFAVVPAIRSPLAACGDEGGKAGEWVAGMLEIREVASIEPHLTLYAVGCCFLCTRAAWLSLGGYDEIFAPFLFEDVDLSFRAWRRGLRVLHAPEAVCHHEGSATLSEQRSVSERERISFRNRALFHLRNLHEQDLRAACYGALAAYALLEPLPQRREGLREALAAYERSGPRPAEARSDRQLFEALGIQ